jgi:hypothetical protein
MPHTYLLFDFATDEEKAQLARHKLETWKQAFRLDKKLLYKFDRATSGDGAEPSVEEKPAKPAEEAKPRASQNPIQMKSEAKSGNAEPDTPDTKEATLAEPVKLLIRLDFSSHEKLSSSAGGSDPHRGPLPGRFPRVIKPNDTEFADTEKQFEFGQSALRVMLCHQVSQSAQVVSSSVKVNSQPTFSIPRNFTFFCIPTIFIRPNVWSTRFRFL